MIEGEESRMRVRLVECYRSLMAIRVVKGQEDIRQRNGLLVETGAIAALMFLDMQYNAC